MRLLALTALIIAAIAVLALASWYFWRGGVEAPGGSGQAGEEPAGESEGMRLLEAVGLIDGYVVGAAFWGGYLSVLYQPGSEGSSGLTAALVGLDPAGVRSSVELDVDYGDGGGVALVGYDGSYMYLLVEAGGGSYRLYAVNPEAGGQASFDIGYSPLSVVAWNGVFYAAGSGYLEAIDVVEGYVLWRLSLAEVLAGMGLQYATSVALEGLWVWEGAAVALYTIDALGGPAASCLLLLSIGYDGRVEASILYPMEMRAGYEGGWRGVAAAAFDGAGVYLAMVNYSPSAGGYVTLEYLGLDGYRRVIAERSLEPGLTEPYVAVHTSGGLVLLAYASRQDSGGVQAALELYRDGSLTASNTVEWSLGGGGVAGLEGSTAYYFSYDGDYIHFYSADLASGSESYLGSYRVRGAWEVITRLIAVPAGIYYPGAYKTGGLMVWVYNGYIYLLDASRGVLAWAAGGGGG